MRHRRMQAPINSIKHYVQLENSTIADGARRSQDLVNAVGQAAVSNAQDVVEGSIVKAVFIEIWCKSNASAGTDLKFQFAIEKVSSGAVPLSFTDMNSLMGYENKKNILYYSQGVVGDLTTNSIPLFKGWILIPKGKQRFGLGDSLVIAISSTSAISQSCGFATYKEYK